MPDRNDRLNGRTHSFDRDIIVAEVPDLTTKLAKLTKEIGAWNRRLEISGAIEHVEGSVSDLLDAAGVDSFDLAGQPRAFRRESVILESLVSKQIARLRTSLSGLLSDRAPSIHSQLSLAGVLIATLWLSPALADEAPPATAVAGSAYDVLEQLMADTARVSREVELWNAKAKLEDAKTKVLKAEAENRKLAQGGDAAATSVSATASAARTPGSSQPAPDHKAPPGGDDELRILDIRGPAGDFEARVQAPGHPVQRIHGPRRGDAASEVPGFGKVVAVGPYCIQFDARKSCFDDQAAPAHRLAADIPGMALPPPAEPVIHLPGGRDVQIGAAPVITPVAPPRLPADPGAQRPETPGRPDRAEQGQDVLGQDKDGQQL